MDNYVIAFIDLLGSKSKIMNDNDHVFFNQIRHLYTNVASKFDGFDGGHIKMRIYSDNILFARRISDDEENKILNLHQMTCIVAMFQLLSTLNRCMVKGGIVFGEFYIDDIMVWGKGLVDAYSLESDKGHVFPTILLGGDAEKIALKSQERFQMVCATDSGKLFVDYLQFKDNAISEDVSVLALHRNAISEMFSCVKSDRLHCKKTSDSILAKLNWLQDYHNKTCKNQKCDDYIVEESLLC